MKIIVTATTFPTGKKDKASAFVKEQVEQLLLHDSSLEVIVHTPHNSFSPPDASKKKYEESRFHYFWPREAEKLTGRGIMPALADNPLYYFVLPFFFVANFISLLWLTISRKPDLIYAHWFVPQGVNAALVSAITKTPYIFTSHSSDIQVLSRVPFFIPFAIWCISKAEAWTAVSEKTVSKARETLGEKNWKKVNGQLQIIPMGIEDDFFNEAKITKIKVSHSLRSIVRDKTVFFYIGRLEEIKGIHILVDAFANYVHEEMTNAVLVIAGEGTMKEKLFKQVADRRINDYVYFAGHVRDENKQFLFNKASIIVIPSIIDSSGHTEGLPVVLMEALASSKIVIASDVSGGELLINDGINGYLYSHNDSQDLHRKIKKSANLINTQSSLLITKEAKATAQQFSWNVLIPDYINLLHRSIK